MKYYILNFLLFFFFFSAFGQITITSNDLLDAGDSVTLAVLDAAPPGFAPGPSGANQHWDFSNLIMDTTNQINFVDPASTPYAANFPSSNIAVEGMYDSAWAYTTKNNFVFQIDGLAGSYDIFEDVAAHFEPPEIMFNFPINYLDSLEQTSTLQLVIPSPEPPADSIRIKVVTSLSSKVDAWGELITPVWTGDVLRFKDFRVTIDSVWVKLIGFWIYLESSTDVSITYKYMANYAGYPVMQFNSDTSGTEYSSINYLLDIGTGKNELRADNDIVFDIYPNPASTEVYCRMQNAEVKGTILIYDVAGRKMDEVLLPAGMRQHRIDVSAYPSGLYHLIFRGSTIYTAKKFIVD